MSSEAKKVAVFKQLDQEIEPITLQQLLQKLGLAYPERSVRRWLMDMVSEGLIKKIGRAHV